VRSGEFLAEVAAVCSSRALAVDEKARRLIDACAEPLRRPRNLTRFKQACGTLRTLFSGRLFEGSGPAASQFPAEIFMTLQRMCENVKLLLPASRGAHGSIRALLEAANAAAVRGSESDRRAERERARARTRALQAKLRNNLMEGDSIDETDEERRLAETVGVIGEDGEWHAPSGDQEDLRGAKLWIQEPRMREAVRLWHIRWNTLPEVASDDNFRLEGAVRTLKSLAATLPEIKIVAGTKVRGSEVSVYNDTTIECAQRCAFPQNASLSDSVLDAYKREIIVDALLKAIKKYGEEESSIYTGHGYLDDLIGEVYAKYITRFTPLQRKIITFCNSNLPQHREKRMKRERKDAENPILQPTAFEMQQAYWAAQPNISKRSKGRSYAFSAPKGKYTTWAL